jgi:hypothetical protein
MASRMKRKSLVLTEEEWQKLQLLAENFDVCSPTGINVGNPSWRSLMKALANGELEVMYFEDVDRVKYDMELAEHGFDEV